VLVLEEEVAMIGLVTPLKDGDLRRLNAGDFVSLSGTVFTARDKAHLFFLESGFDSIRDSVIYHCGPIVVNENGTYSIVAAGPTTSARMNKYTPQLMEKYGIKAIIGKGGMDREVLNAMKGRAVYLSAVGGAALIYADSVVSVRNVHKLEFGMPEAVWELEVKNMPAIVTMDSKGNSLHADVLRESRRKVEALLR
jgi:tartrate/fumarate subfamily iron-sulfur-dependent hydro-lyase beta chain